VRSNSTEHGLSLIELMITLVILGIVLAFSVPALGSSRQTHALKDATNNVASQLRLARQMALASGTARPFHFAEDSAGYDYHVHQPDGRIVGWSLPHGVHFTLGAGTSVGLVMNPSGRASQTVNVILANGRGARDSVSVQLSGYVLTH
jgi:type IV fimbrial biogenesis protein FimT